MSKKEKIKKINKKYRKMQKAYKKNNDWTQKLRDTYKRAGEEIALLHKSICYKGLAGEYVIFEREKRGQECTEDKKKRVNIEQVWKHASVMIQEDIQTGENRVEDQIQTICQENCKMTVREFCMHETRPRELCIFRRNGWITGATWIDHEDAFSMIDSIKNKEVKSDEWGTLSIVTEQGEPVDIPVHYIDY